MKPLREKLHLIGMEQSVSQWRKIKKNRIFHTCQNCLIRYIKNAGKYVRVKSKSKYGKISYFFILTFSLERRLFMITRAGYYKICRLQEAPWLTRADSDSVIMVRADTIRPADTCSPAALQPCSYPSYHRQQFSNAEWKYEIYVP